MRLARRLLLFGGVLVIGGLLAGELAVRLRPELLPRWYRIEYPLNGIEFLHPGILAQTPIEGYPVPGWMVSYEGPAGADLVTSVALVDPDANPDPERIPRIAVHIDANGFPNARVPGSADVVMVGDSFGVAAGLVEPPGLQHQLAQATGLDIYNMSVSGIGPVRQAWLLERCGLPLSPRVVVWLFFGGNDLLDATSAVREQNTGARTFADLPAYRPPPTSRLGGLVSAWLAREEVDQGPRSGPTFEGLRLAEGPDAGVPFWFLPNHLYLLYLKPFEWQAMDGWAAATEAIRRAHALCTAADARLLLVYVPSKAQVMLPFVADQPEVLFEMMTLGKQGNLTPETYLERALANKDKLERHMRVFCESEGIPFLSATQPLRAQANGGRLGYLCADTHWSHVGQGTLIGPLVAKLAELGVPGEQH